MTLATIYEQIKGHKGSVDRDTYCYLIPNWCGSNALAYA